LKKCRQQGGTRVKRAVAQDRANAAGRKSLIRKALLPPFDILQELVVRLLDTVPNRGGLGSIPLQPSAKPI
jgi:hypothetical protein